MQALGSSVCTSRSASAISPMSYPRRPQCRKCRGTRLSLTARTRGRLNKVLGGWWQYQYKCKECGWVGWTSHPKALAVLAMYPPVLPFSEWRPAR